MKRNIVLSDEDLLSFERTRRKIVATGGRSVNQLSPTEKRKFVVTLAIMASVKDDTVPVLEDVSGLKKTKVEVA